VHAKSPTRRLAIEARYAIWKRVGTVEGRSTGWVALAVAGSRAGRGQAAGVCGQLSISSDHFFIFLSILTTLAPELSEFCGQN
jgi:hypothetical protein